MALSVYGRLEIGTYVGSTEETHQLLGETGFSFLAVSTHSNMGLYADKVYFICSSLARNMTNLNGGSESSLGSTWVHQDMKTILLPYLPQHEWSSSEIALKYLKAEKSTQCLDGRLPELWFHVPMHGRSCSLHIGKDDTPFPVLTSRRSAFQQSQSVSASHYWYTILLLTNYSKHVKVALELTTTDNLSRLPHWLSEPVACLILGTVMFSRKRMGDDEVSFTNPDHECILKKMIQLNKCRIILRRDPDTSVTKLSKCMEYLASYAKYLPEKPTWSSKYLHYTMQPLHSNLEESDYAGFELDTTKYNFYRNAIAKALEHLRRSRKPGCSGDIFVVAVLGCGRGPLVTKSLEAAAQVSAKVKVYAVEKNPKAVESLRKKLTGEWSGENVVLHFGDMRDWKPQEKLDVIVSEMLGNFACDECCPEALCIPETFLKSDGISIPTSYVNYLSPISSTRLFVELKHSFGTTRQQMRAFGLQQFDFLDLDEVQPVVNFHHGYKENVIRPRSTSKTVDFIAKTDGILHGFAGYFETVLFGDVKLCTIEGKRTIGLGSWDPVFFPLENPVPISEKARIRLQFRRRCGEDRIWYEWQLLQPEKQKIQNLGGECCEFSLVIQKDSKNDVG